jgi:exosortase B
MKLFASRAATSPSPLLNPSPFLLLSVGWLAMFGPVYWQLSQSLWRTDEQAHGALILIVTLWLLWQLRERLTSLAFAGGARAPAAGGWALLALGAALYVLGRSQNVWVFTIGSQIPVMAGGLVLLRGWGALRVAWFPLLFLVFMIPIPGILVDAMTGPLKSWVSELAEQVLYTLGFPVARSGVILSIGPYELLIADACSGLHSLFSLSALGLLFLYLNARPGLWHNALMLASILPIAFLANTLRVIALMLITYYYGERAGQGFLHEFSGVALLGAALLCLFALDGALARLRRP